jgi:hypothetical protein
VPAEKLMLGTEVQQNERKNVVSAIIAIAIVVVILWVFLVLLRP